MLLLLLGGSWEAKRDEIRRSRAGTKRDPGESFAREHELLRRSSLAEEEVEKGLKADRANISPRRGKL